MTVPVSPSGLRRTAVDALRELILAGEAYRHALAGHFGMGVTETAAVSYLHARGQLGQHELGRYLGINSSSVTQLIDRLEGRGFAERRADPEDRRRSVVRLTKAGEATIETSRQWFAGAFDNIPTDLATATDLLRTLATGLRANTAAVPDPDRD